MAMLDAELCAAVQQEMPQSSLASAAAKDSAAAGIYRLMDEDFPLSYRSSI
jgi:hypothetical protein